MLPSVPASPCSKFSEDILKPGCPGELILGGTGGDIANLQNWSLVGGQIWSLLVTALTCVITDHNTDQARNVSPSYLWPTRDMMASLESVPVPASAVWPPPPPPTLGLTDWKSLKPRDLGLWDVSPSFDLEDKGVSVSRGSSDVREAVKDI